MKIPKKIIESKYFKIFAFIFVLLIWFTIWKQGHDYNSSLCKAIMNKEIKGKITGLGGSGSYQWIEINNKSYKVNFSKIKSTNGITDDYFDYQINDSILKSMNSNEVEIKRGKNRNAIFILDCKESE